MFNVGIRSEQSRFRLEEITPRGIELTELDPDQDHEWSPQRIVCAFDFGFREPKTAGVIALHVRQNHPRERLGERYVAHLAERGLHGVLEAEVQVDVGKREARAWVRLQQVIGAYER